MKKFLCYSLLLCLCVFGGLALVSKSTISADEFTYSGLHYEEKYYYSAIANNAANRIYELVTDLAYNPYVSYTQYLNGNYYNLLNFDYDGFTEVPVHVSGYFSQPLQIRFTGYHDQPANVHFLDNYVYDHRYSTTYYISVFTDYLYSIFYENEDEERIDFRIAFRVNIEGHPAIIDYFRYLETPEDSYVKGGYEYYDIDYSNFTIYYNQFTIDTLADGPSGDPDDPTDVLMLNEVFTRQAGTWHTQPAQKESTWQDLLDVVVRLPLPIITTIFGWTLFGVKFYQILASLLTIAIFVWLIFGLRKKDD